MNHIAATDHVTSVKKGDVVQVLYKGVWRMAVIHAGLAWVTVEAAR